jgi:hypothetical protein
MTNLTRNNFKAHPFHIAYKRFSTSIPRNGFKFSESLLKYVLKKNHYNANDIATAPQNKSQKEIKQEENQKELLSATLGRKAADNFCENEPVTQEQFSGYLTIKNLYPDFFLPVKLLKNPDKVDLYNMESQCFNDVIDHLSEIQKKYSPTPTADFIDDLPTDYFPDFGDE